MLQSKDMRPPVKYTHITCTLSSKSVSGGGGQACHRSMTAWQAWPVLSAGDEIQPQHAGTDAGPWSSIPIPFDGPELQPMWCGSFFFFWVCHVHLAHTGLWYQVAAVWTPPPHSLQGATGRLNKHLFHIWCLWTAVYQRKKIRRKCQVFFSTL